MHHTALPSTLGQETREGRPIPDMLTMASHTNGPTAG
jgi:hypothetical protein